MVCEVAGVRSFFFTGMSSSVISCRFYGLSIYFLFNCSVLIIYTVLGTKVGGGGGILIFSYYVGWGHFFGFNILNFSIF